MREHKKSHIGMISWGMFLAGALSLGSCSGDETLETMEKKAIAFGNVTMENLSRATDPSYSAKDIASFQVWGTVTGNAGSALIFDGATINKTADYGVAWTQVDGQPQYWIPGADYEFLAIVDGNKSGVTSITEEDGLGMPTTISYTADGETDLLCQKVSRPDNNDESVVAFQFTHLLSKVHFTFQAKSASQTIDVANIQVTGHYASATYNIGAETPWSNQQPATTSLSFGGLDPNNTDATTSEYARLIIPGKQTWTITFDHNEKPLKEPLILDGDDNQGYPFAPNTEYNIIVTVGSNITFTVESLAEWNKEETNVTIKP